METLPTLTVRSTPHV